MKYLKTTFKYIRRLLLGFIGIIVLYLIFAFLLSVIPTRTKSVTCLQEENIYLMTNGVHLDIVLEKDQLTEEFWQSLNLPSRTNYVAFGWGDKGFYLKTKTWGDLKASTAINALFLKSSTAMHVTAYRSQQKSFVPIRVCSSQMNTLKTYIENSFQKNNQNQPIKVEKGYYWNDNFYEAKGSYNAIKTCNEWVNRGLKKANITTSIWSPFDKGVLHQVKKQ